MQIRNFRNFAALDARLSRNAVILGENRVGKSNFLYAIRLVLDARLSDAARQLSLTDFWDGCDLEANPEIQIDLDFCEFESDPDLICLLTDHRLADPEVARLSFLFRKKPTIDRVARSDADFEFLTFGGGIETNNIPSDLRRRLALDILPALRDAESELATWRSSPLRPLIEDAIGTVPSDELDSIGQSIQEATEGLASLQPISMLEADLRARIAALAGDSQDLNAKLAFAPTDPLRVLRSIGLFIDNGKRSIAEASAGSANIALLSLKFAEFDWRAVKNERDFTVLCVEEPEAHLHPHLQRQIFKRIFAEAPEHPREIIVTTHSPHIASVAPLECIVVIRDSGKGSLAYSLAGIGLSDGDREDLQRYLNSTRAELLYSKGCLFVEGDAEETLLPVFADSMQRNLDALGITICSVAGTNFAPYVRLATSLNLPFAVITDWDPVASSKPLGWTRAIALLNEINVTRKRPPLAPPFLQKLDQDEGYLRERGESQGIFMNDATFEVEISRQPALLAPLISVLQAADFGAIRRARLKAWLADSSKVDASQLMPMIADIGKGRLAGRFAIAAKGLTPPEYIQRAIDFVTSRV